MTRVSKHFDVKKKAAEKALALTVSRFTSRKAI